VLRDEERVSGRGVDGDGEVWSCRRWCGRCERGGCYLDCTLRAPGAANLARGEVFVRAEGLRAATIGALMSVSLFRSVGVW
jgi:hypothetical protein